VKKDIKTLLRSRTSNDSQYNGQRKGTKRQKLCISIQ